MTGMTAIIPSYNRALLLEKTLFALSLQSNTNFNVVLVDHGSTDDTEKNFEKYVHKLNIEYYRLQRDGFSSASARALGAKKAKTPIIAFLDSDIVVSSYYVDSHIKFHQMHPHHVGIGLCHGYLISADDECWKLLAQQSVDDAQNMFARHPNFYDERKDENLADFTFPWKRAWSGIVSMMYDDYCSVDGFDIEHKGWEFEDMDLAYRLFRHGTQFSFVEDGWGVHLPHPHEEFRASTEIQNCRSSYLKQKSLTLEALLYTRLGYDEAAEAAFRYLTTVGNIYAKRPTLSSRAKSLFARPSLFIGGVIDDAPFYDYVALANENVLSTHSLHQDIVNR